MALVLEYVFYHGIVCNNAASKFYLILTFVYFHILILVHQYWLSTRADEMLCYVLKKGKNAIILEKHP